YVDLEATNYAIPELVEFFFFFQAEDGIRDGHVTGVQTCALPIFPLNSAIAYSICASVLSASEAAASRRAVSTASFGTPRPSLYKVASAYWASGFPTWAALRKSCAARAKSCGNNWPSI